MKTLECSSRGDKRYSAFYAQVQVFGKMDSIENHYQLSKRFGDAPAPRSWRECKGRKPTHIEINGSLYPLELLSQWYKLLWCKYLDKNPELVAHAKQFDRFNDMFRGKALNCQADVIEQYVKHGRESIIKECQPLIKRLNERRKTK